MRRPSTVVLLDLPSHIRRIMSALLDLQVVCAVRQHLDARVREVLLQQVPDAGRRDRIGVS